MTNGREMMPPLGFSTPPHIPNVNTSERPPITSTVFVVTTPENTLFAYRASTSAKLNPVIGPSFVEANYEVLESLLRERQRRMLCEWIILTFKFRFSNEDLRSGLEYFSEDYGEEREIESRPEPTKKTTPPLQSRSTGIHRQRERIVGFEEAPNREGSKAGRNAKGSRLSKIEIRENGNRGMNLPPLLVAHLGRNKSGQPLKSYLIFVYRHHQPTTNTGGISLLTNGNPSTEGTSAYHSQGGYTPQTFTNNDMPSYNRSMYPVVTPSNSTGSVTPYVRWFKDYPLLNGLKMPSHIGSYDGKEDPDNFLYLFEGAIRMQKELMPRISGSVPGLRTRSLIEHLSTDLPSTYKDLMEKTYIWIEAREVATNGAPNDQREYFKRSKKSTWDNNRGRKGKRRQGGDQGACKVFGFLIGNFMEVLDVLEWF
uniref:Uncharacterized protein n=1 Tax=Tanacetum cinerariifolium TaxID=118510 RepID=A0A6L2KT97_TANCI|nr:hypothetical protein [Tanacetum cinerariifolium]